MSKEKIQFDSGNREMVKWMYNQLKKVGGEHVKYYEYESTSKCTVYKKAIKRVHSKIYSGSGPSLQRKKNYLQDKSQIDDKDSKILEGETTTSSTGIASIQGKTFIKKNPIKTQAIMQGSEDVIDSRKKDSLLVYLLKKNNKFFVKTEKDGVILEFYVFDNEEDALQMFNKIKED